MHYPAKVPFRRFRMGLSRGERCGRWIGGVDFYFNRAKNKAVVREPAGETLLVYRGCGNADDGRAVTLKRNGVLITVSQR